ncbi:SRPBCC family protein [Pseudotabrizicola algicola]|uniref:SRPBCC family protein n=1 Tax=Pseudotabrizicola algicola TaxID=2709381 RepID=A0A6B3RKC0_9RHOB|nr:SRPBCC family protein [Pseudotabrizicola algicola]NEX46480.1 SRPBCC family protein [Pseudotabrizicola algicola]
MTHHQDERSRQSIAWLALGAVAVTGLVGASVLTRQPMARHDADSAPGRTARQMRYGRFAVVGRTVTIHRPRDEVYRFWRDPSNLPTIMDHVAAITEQNNDLWTWQLDAPAGMTVHLETEIVSDRPGSEIAWKSTEASQVRTQGKVMFSDAPGDRGTEVEAIIAYTPVLGELGRLIAKLAGKDPETQGRRALKRLKMLLETGEIATSRNQREPEAPTAKAAESQQA